MSDQEFDVVVLGASGFTGRLVAEYLQAQYGDSIRWAMAGRNQDKLEEVRAEVGADAVPIVIADSSDEASLRELCEKTSVVCTTVGPYARYGSILVGVCADTGTHYCDLTGEVQWMRRMIDQHQTGAEETGARIVHTCGFDSIPSDLGTFFVQQQMHDKHGVYASKVKCRIADSRGGFSGGTVESLMNVMDEAKEDRAIFTLMSDPYALNPLNLPPGKDQPDQASAVYDADFKQWTAPFVMAGINTRVVRRSHALAGFPYGDDFTYEESMLTGGGPGGFAMAQTISGASGLMMMAAATTPMRKLLRRMAPSPGEGPSRETIESGYFEIEFMGKHPSDSSKDICARVTGDRDPGYGATSKMLAEAAVCLALDELDSPGGVTTPAVAMGQCLVERLGKNAGMTFSVHS